MSAFELPPGRRRGRIDSVVPMINIVFLLLIFFLMTATIAPPDPLAVRLPEGAAGDAAGRSEVLHVAADGRLAYGEARGEAVFAAIAARGPDAPALRVRADRGLEGAALADLLARIGAAGAGPVRLVVGQR